jgi:hypothetical protein
MPKTKFDAKAESTQFEMIPDGDYPFEVMACDFSISTGNKTAGSEVMEVKVRFFKDSTFTKPMAQWTESLIFHPSCDWKISVFTKCANMLVDGQLPADGAEIDYTAEAVVGLRGWATVRNKPSTQDKDKRWNYVAAWLTTKEKLARRELHPDETPAGVPAGGDDEGKLPF